MTRFEQDGSIYDFPDDICEVLPSFDEQSFYRRLSKLPAKGCDIVAMREGDLYLIEAKDYAHANPGKSRKPFEELAPEVARKAFDTLAALVVGAHTASDDQIRRFCSRALQYRNLFVVATVELVRNPHNEREVGESRRYRALLRERLEGLVKRPLGVKQVLVTGNGCSDRGKFWASHWSPDHD